MKKILLLPGLGDVHWVFLRLRSWLERQGPEWSNPEVWIWDIDHRPRTIEFFKYVPWITPGGYFDLPVKSELMRFDSLYQRKHATDVIYDFHGFDALIATNGSMRNGAPFESLMSGAAIDWDYGPVFPPELDDVGRAQRALGPYVLLFVSNLGMFAQAWTNKVGASSLRALVAELRERLPGRRFIWTGCEWDAPFTSQCATDREENLVGRTSLEELFSLIRRSDGFVGWCGGNSILAQHLGTPTVDWWSRRYFPKHDRTGWQHPNARRLCLETEDYDPRSTPGQVARFLGESPPRP